MTKQLTTARILALLLLLVILASCTTPTMVVPLPTTDLGAVRTEAAQTVVVKITLEAALNPSATPEAPQVKVEESAVEGLQAAATATPTETPTSTNQAPTETQVPTSTRQAPPNNAIYPTRTPRMIPDAASLVDSTPYDGTVYHPGNKFDAVWKVKNVGTSTWTSSYYIRYARGANMSEAPRYYLSGDVKPGETVELIADLVAPDEKGIHVGYWEFVNGNGDIIYRMYVAITVE